MDGVIKNFREMHVSSWNDVGTPEFYQALHRLRAMYPGGALGAEETQTHLLHLATDGEIYPHIDNVTASGSWILGVSLGTPRLLRMESVSDGAPNTFELVLPSGSIYTQQ